jgi:hypothetical protein
MCSWKCWLPCWYPARSRIFCKCKCRLNKRFSFWFPARIDNWVSSHNSWLLSLSHGCSLQVSCSIKSPFPFLLFFWNWEHKLYFIFVICDQELPKVVKKRGLRVCQTSTSPWLMEQETDTWQTHHHAAFQLQK